MNSKEFIMILLDRFNGRIESATRVQKLAFLAIQESDISPFTVFQWRDYGPFSSELKGSLQELEMNGFIQIKNEKRTTFMGDPYNIRIFQLTDKGQACLQQIKGKIKNDDLRTVYSIVEDYGHNPLSEILNYVYEAYSPDDL